MHAVSETLQVAAPWLRWIVAAPLAGSVFHLLLGRRAGRAATALVACGAMAAAFALSIAAFLDLRAAAPGTVLVDAVYPWIASGDFRVDATLAVDALSAVMLLVITGVGLLIHAYSAGYMAHDDGHARYFGYLNLFVAAMLVLVLADSLPLLFVGWEGVGLCSYLLIGFWYEDAANASAGTKAFVTNRVGDVGFLLGSFLLAWGLWDAGAPGLGFANINAHAAALPPALAMGAAALLFVGATGKSAQLPLHVWLPDAMAGPTPVSALIHAATMVTAGVYLTARLHGLYEVTPLVTQWVGGIGATTALMAATIAVTQNDIKKVLAYSTISQLGFMFVAVGVGAPGFALFHVVTHAFFKALLFLGAGSVIHGLDGQQDIRRMGGLARRMPVTHATFAIGVLAIAGAPGLAGFFSKDAILAAAWAGGHRGLWTAGIVAAVLTAFYMTRLYVLVFRGEFRDKDRARFEHAHESPASMTLPLLVLAVLSAAGGLLGLPAVLGGSDLFAQWLSPVLGTHGAHLPHDSELLLMAVSVGAALLGLGGAWILYGRAPRADRDVARALRNVYPRIQRGYDLDALYARIVGRPLDRWAGHLSQEIESGVVDGSVLGVGAAAEGFGSLLRRWASGNVQHYLLTVLLGVAAVIAAVVARGGR